MGRNLFSVKRIARECGRDPVDAALVLAGAGFSVVDEDSQLNRRDARRARDLLICESKTQTGHDPVVEEPKWPAKQKTVPIEMLSVETVLEIHDALTVEFRGTPDAVDPPGLRDTVGLESALARPQVARAKYHTVPLAAAAILHGLNANHAFHNGNKRTSLLGIAIFIENLNGMYLEASEDDLFALVVDTARHTLLPADTSNMRERDPWFADREVLAIYNRLRRVVKVPERREKTLKWRDLRTCLENLECEVGSIDSNQAKIRRQLANGSYLQVVSGASNEGDEVNARDVRRIRKELQLTEEFGVDSAIFYGHGRPHPELPELITKYRGVLERLSLLDREH